MVVYSKQNLRCAHDGRIVMSPGSQQTIRERVTVIMSRCPSPVIRY